LVTIADIVPAQVSLDHEKRRKKRFSIDHEVRYRTLAGQRIVETGMGRTINISSSGACFTSEKRLPIGTSVELSINWPVLLEDDCPMKLMLQGCVIRSSSNDVAISTRECFHDPRRKTMRMSRSIHQPG